MRVPSVVQRAKDECIGRLYCGTGGQAGITCIGGDTCVSGTCQN